MTLDDLCHVCDLDYDYIVKVETMSTDAEWLVPEVLQTDAAVGAPYKSSMHKADDGSHTPRHVIPTLNAGIIILLLLTKKFNVAFSPEELQGHGTHIKRRL